MEMVVVRGYLFYGMVKVVKGYLSYGMVKDRTMEGSIKALPDTCSEIEEFQSQSMRVKSMPVKTNFSLASKRRSHKYSSSYVLLQS